MNRIRLDEDLRSVTEFRAHTATVIERVRTTKRPVVLTQHGRGAAVVLDVEEFQRMLDAIDEVGAAGNRAALPAPTVDPVDAYRGDVDRSLIRENLKRPVAERLQRLEEMAGFAEQLRAAGRRAEEA